MVCVTSNLGLPYTYHFWYSYPFPSLKGMSFQRIRSRLPFYKYIVKKLSEYFFFSLPSKRHWKYVFQRKSIKSPFFDFWPSLWRVNNVVSEYRNFLPVWLPFPCWVRNEAAFFVAHPLRPFLFWRKRSLSHATYNISGFHW